MACGLPHPANELQFFEKSELLEQRHQVTIQKTQVFNEILMYNRIRPSTAASQ